MAVASILLVGVAAAYSALGRTAHRLALAQAGLVHRPVPACRAPADGSPPAASPAPRQRCTLAERCDYDPVSQSCRPTALPN